MVIKYLTLLLSVLISCKGSRRSAPEALDEKWEIEKYMYDKFNIMTDWLVQDATIKLRHAERVQEKYRHVLAYDLGSISAGIQDTFRHMLDVYRKYSNMSDFRSWKYTTEEIFNAYHIIKGDFNEIHLMRMMYYEVLEEHSKKEQRGKKVADTLQDLLAQFKEANDIARRAGGGRKNTSRSAPKPFKETEEFYKKQLRLKKWEEKWKNFVPEVEGVAIDIPDILPDSGRPKEGSL